MRAKDRCWNGHPGALRRSKFKNRLLDRIAALLCFQHKALLSVKINVICGRRAVEFLVMDGLINHVGVQAFVGLTRLGPRHVKIDAKL